jgi:hypothetical protein
LGCENFEKMAYFAIISKLISICLEGFACLI